MRTATMMHIRCGIAAILGGLLSGPGFAQSGITRAQSAPVVTNVPPGPAQPQQAQQPAGAQRALAAPSLDGMPRPTPLPGQPLPANANGSVPPPVVVPQIPITEDALNRIAPLTADEVLELRKEMQRRRQAVQQVIEPVAKPVRRAITLDMSATSAPEVVRVTQGQGAVIAFYDAAGRPWPVTVGDSYSTRLDVALFGTNGLSVGLKSPLIGRTNLAILLQGLDTPVVLSVLPAGDETDVSLEVQVPKYVPSLPAPVSAAHQMASLNSAELLDYLLGTPPNAARALATSSAVVKAWQTSPDRMIVRTTALVAAPAWTRRQSSGTGVTVYEMPLSPVVTVAVDGALSLVRFEGFAGTSAGGSQGSARAELR